LLILLSLIAIVNSTSLLNSAFAQSHNENGQIPSQSPNTDSTVQRSSDIPAAETVYQSQSMTLPSSVGSFVWYIVDEAHENSINEKHKYISDHNPIYLPTNIIIPEGTSITFLDADAPWDTPHPHIINIIDSSGKVVYSTEKLGYTNSSTPKVLPSGKYSVVDTKYTWMKGNITVRADEKSAGTLVSGGFYTPTNQVVNNKDGGTHPGWLGYYKTEFPANGFRILSTFDFHYATCKYCPGGYWPDQKTGDHTLIIYSTDQPLSSALRILSKMVWNNVYI
jgi:hypothetical protein